jgi:alpha-1,2-mannosyltransferase
MQSTTASRKTLLALIAMNALVYLFYVRAIPAGSLDFQAFYYAGETAWRAPNHIYDLDYQRLTHREHFGDQHQFLPFFHPPHEILVFLPFSTLPYAASFNAWRVFSLLCLAASGLLLGRAIGVNRITAVIFILAISEVGECLILGQDSLLLLVLLCGCFYLLKQERDVAAAFVLSMALFKPQIPVVLAVAVLAAGRKKFFAWFAGSGAVLAAASIWFVGRDGVQQMLEGEKLAEHSIATMPTVRGLIAFMVGDHLWLALALLAVALIAMFSAWRRSQSLDFAVGSAICLGSAFTPYILTYDLVVLAIPLTLIAQRPQKHDGLIGAILTSAMFLLIVNLFKASSLLVIPTLALGIMTFRLASPVNELVPLLAAEAGPAQQSDKQQATRS